MTITQLSAITLTSQEQTDILVALVIPWALVFEDVQPGSSAYLSYVGGLGSDPEELTNWAWVGNPLDRPSDILLMDAYPTVAAQFQADILEAARVEKWKSIVQAEVTEDFENIPGWFSWTEEEVLNWITNNLNSELASYPKTLQAITGLARLLVTVRNWVRPDLEGSS